MAECDSDEGLLYVRDKRTRSTHTVVHGGRFKRVLSPPVSLHLTKPCPFVQNLDGYYSAKSLFDICKQLVVLNLDTVASFKRFPEMVGKELFKDAIKLNVLSDDFENERCFRRLYLFLDEYGSNLLTHLNCSERHGLFVEPIWKHLNALLDVSSLLVKLDISRCKLADDHQVFNTFQKLLQLTHLRLAHNYITSDGIRMLTLSVRVADKGPSKLIYLDLSENSFLTKEALKFITDAFKRLQHLNLSQTLIQESDCSSLLQSGFVINSNEFENIETYSTLGWAADLVVKWQNRNTAGQSDHHSLKFYGSSKNERRNSFVSTAQNRLILTRSGIKFQTETASIGHKRKNLVGEKPKNCASDDDELLMQYV